jgi:hypothetical protein
MQLLQQNIFTALKVRHVVMAECVDGASEGCESMQTSLNAKNSTALTEKLKSPSDSFTFYFTFTDKDVSITIGKSLEGLLWFGCHKTSSPCTIVHQNMR